MKKLARKSTAALLGAGVFLAPVAVNLIAPPVASACRQYDRCDYQDSDLVWVDAPEGRPAVQVLRWQVDDGWCWVKRDGYDGYGWYFDPPDRHRRPAYYLPGPSFDLNIAVGVIVN